MEESVEVQIARMSGKIGSEIGFLQEEHRIFKRPFVFQGIDYLEVLSRQNFQYEIDEVSMAGNIADSASSTHIKVHHARDASC